MNNVKMILINAAALLTGILIGSMVNMGLIELGAKLVPAPEGFDISTPERMKETIHLLQPVHFVFPFLAHALGTFAGAFIATYIGRGNLKMLATVIGIVFLTGGVYMAFLLDAPPWFEAIDLLFAYLPCAWLGLRLRHSVKSNT